MPATSFATKAGLTALIALVQSLPTMQGTVNRGMRESFPSLLSAYVAVGLPTISRTAAGGLVQMDAVYFVGFVYAIAGAEETAEDDLADAIDDFVREIEQDPSVGGAFGQVRWISPGFSSPDYQLALGQEVRHVQFIFEAQMRETVVRS